VTGDTVISLKNLNSRDKRKRQRAFPRAQCPSKRTARVLFAAQWQHCLSGGLRALRVNPRGNCSACGRNPRVNLAISSGGSTTPFRKLKASSIRAYPRHEFRASRFWSAGTILRSFRESVPITVIGAPACTGWLST